MRLLLAMAVSFGGVGTSAGLAYLLDRFAALCFRPNTAIEAAGPERSGL